MGGQLSRSYKKNPIFGITTADSEKWDKTYCNRRFRRLEKAAIEKGTEPPIRNDEAVNYWWFAKDGKHYMADWASEKNMRK